MANEIDIRKFADQANLPSSSYKRPLHSSNKKVLVQEYIDEFTDNNLLSSKGDYRPFLYYNASRSFVDKKNSPYFTFKRYEDKFDIKREWRLIDQDYVPTVYLAFAINTKVDNHDDMFINASSKGFSWTKNQVFNLNHNLHTVNCYGEFRNLNQLAFALILNNDETLINKLANNLKTDEASISKVPVKRLINGQEIDCFELDFCMKEYTYTDAKYPFIQKSYIIHKALTKELLKYLDTTIQIKLLQSNGDYLNSITSNPQYFNCKKDNWVKSYLQGQEINTETQIVGNKELEEISDITEITNNIKKRRYTKRLDRSPFMIDYIDHYVDTEVITKTSNRKTYFYYISDNKNKCTTSIFTTIAPILKNKDANIKAIFRNNQHTGWYAWGVTADNIDSDRVARMLPYINNKVKGHNSFNTIHNFHYIDENGKLQNCDTSPFALLGTDNEDEEAIFLKKVLERKTKLNISLRPCEKEIQGKKKICTEFCFSLYDLPEAKDFTTTSYEKKYENYNRKMFNLMQEFCNPNTPLEQLQADGSIVDKNTSNEGYLILK